MIKHARLPAVPWWLLLAVLVGTSTVSIFALRSNNLRMLELKGELTRTDQQNGDVESALRKLREHIHNHMNTDPSTESGIHPPIQLKYQYERLVAAERQRVTTVNAGIATEAQVACERQFPVGLLNSGRVTCVAEYISAKGVKEQPVNEALYKFDFVSPRWSQDLAGWTLLVSLCFGILLIVRIVLDLWRRSLNN
jgi:preprotein translocase subunit SecF